MQYLIGVDLGTTATKAVLFEKDGKIIASSSQAYPLHRNASGMAEESLEEIFEAVLVTIREVSINLEDEDELLAVSFSTQMHSLIAFDENWQPLTRLITWADTRAVKYTEQIKASKKDSIFIGEQEPLFIRWLLYLNLCGYKRNTQVSIKKQLITWS